MSYLYITENGASVNIDGGYYVVTHKDGTIHKVPKETLESVAVFGNANITVPCTRSFLIQNIPVSFFSSKGSYFGRLESTSGRNIFRLKNQIYLSDDGNFCIPLARKIISAKINNQTVVLKRYTKNSNAVVDEAVKMMKISKEKISSANTIEEIMGYEGTAAKYYFKGLSAIINTDFAFNGRNRMPPKDPFNSMISLGYTLLMYELYGEIENKGLSPYCGFIHQDRERHPTLASDLMEEWRAVVVDSVVLSLIQGNEISRECFETDSETGGVFIDSKGMRIFLNKYEKKLRSANSYIDGMNMSIRKSLWYQVSSLARAIDEKNPDIYNPIILR